VIGYEEAITILKDTRFKNRIPLPQTSKKYEQLKNIQNDMMVFKNQPDHKRLRFLVSNVFTPRMVEHLRPYIQETVNDLLQQVQSKKSMDSDKGTVLRLQTQQPSPCFPCFFYNNNLKCFSKLTPSISGICFKEESLMASFRNDIASCIDFSSSSPRIKLPIMIAANKSPVPE
jgi:hypothetical protein